MVDTRTLRDGALLAVGAGLGAVLATYLRRQGGGSATSGDGLAEMYTAPNWTPSELKVPGQRLRLAHLPTPIHRWDLPGVHPSTAEVWIKRDDCTGCELSGNKVRKLEFLLAEALAGGCDSVITVGGIQSNHCRATAAAARRVGLTPHIILRTANPNADPGLVGNLMLDRMVGANIHLVSDEEFAAKGGWGLVCELKEKLEKKQGAKPYPFPSGGSNDVGTWGYVQAIAEIEQQTKELGVEFDAVYYACGSGGTGAGLALGMHASSLKAELVGLCVDDTPQECAFMFFDKIDAIYAELGLPGLSSASIMRLEQHVGLGYAKSTEAELTFITDVSRRTGVVLDPVYSGKAARGMMQDLQQQHQQKKGHSKDDLQPKRVLFIHTGGLLGLFEKADQLAPLLNGGWRDFATAQL